MFKAGDVSHMSQQSPATPTVAVIRFGPSSRGACGRDFLCRMANRNLRGFSGEMATESLFIIQGYAQTRQALSLGSSPSLQPFIIGLNAAEREGARHIVPLLARA